MIIQVGELRVPLNTCMMKAKLSANLISFVLVRRGDWVFKVSVFKNKQILVVAHPFIWDTDHTLIRAFNNQDDAAQFIDQLAKDNDDQSF